MKKLLKIIFPMLLIVILVSCGSNSTDTFIKDDPGNNSEITLTHKKDEIVSVKVKTTLSYITINAKDRNEAESKLKEYLSEMNMDDSDTEIIYKDKEVEIISTGDVKGEDLKLGNLYNLDTEKDYYSYDEVSKILLASGYEKNK
ncbi:hypothetical protein JZO82_03845 [Vagococcus fluvialis]|uniref:DUF1307 domain-containing protein n=1 Tax=Vagococcus fluvialis TaxID=2738 RepID=UPI001A8F3AAD|nr:DUF1307 domain-containing protein [Vagococcus fluvialis]MBO0428290.1 hypothetical protein [Vagococcus fluvialis]